MEKTGGQLQASPPSNGMGRELGNLARNKNDVGKNKMLLFQIYFKRTI